MIIILLLFCLHRFIFDNLSGGEAQRSLFDIINSESDSEFFSQLTFLEFHFETEAKVDFPSACI